MAIKHNNVVPNVHFRKWWQRYVKTFFNQAGKKKSRRVKRDAKAQKMFPRPTSLLRPAVRPATVRYNFRLRAGRGFTLAELKKAGIPQKKAASIGISVDHRRKNFCEESLKLNAGRLEEYKSKMVLFPRSSKAKKGDTPKGSLPKDVTQNTLKGVLPIQAKPAPEAPRAITAEEKASSAWKVLRTGRAEKRNFGRMIQLANKRLKDDQKNAK